MALPGMPGLPDLGEIQKEAQEKFDEAGMGKVEEFTDMMEDILNKAKEGPDKLLDSAKDGFNGLTKKFQDAIDDPSSLAPDAGPLAAVATWYANAVVGKLGTVNDEAKALVETVGQLVSSVQEPMKKVQETLESAMSKLEGSLKALAKLPKLIAEAIDGKDSPDDIAKIDCGPMKKALDCGDVDGPLDMIVGLKDILKSAVDVILKQMDTIKDFLAKAPDMVKKAFDIPAPLCFLGSCAQYPQFLQDALDMLDKVKEINLQGVVDILKNTMDTLGSLDVSMVKEPMNKFLESAGGIVDKLEKAVSGAKMAGAASNPAGAAKGALAKVGGMFGR